MPDLELIWHADCPNVTAARDLVRAALAEVGRPPRWTEWRIGDPEAPPHATGFGSPTVLVGRRDVVDAAPSGSDCCRVYAHAGGRFRGVPSLESIIEALREASGPDASESAHA